jgi:hypothetical protein
VDHQLDLPAGQALPAAGPRQWPGEERGGQDQVFWGQVGSQLAGSLSALEQACEGCANVGLALAGGTGEDGRAAVEGEHEAFAVAQGGQEEQPDAFQGGARVSGRRSRVVQGKTERAVNQRAEKLLTCGEVTVERPDPDARVLGDLSHRDLLAVAPDQLRRGVQDALAIRGCVLAWPAFDARCHADDDRNVCIGSKRTISSATETDETIRNEMRGVDEDGRV